MFAVGNNIKTISNINFLDRQEFVSWPLQRTLKTLMTHAFEFVVFVLSLCCKNKGRRKPCEAVQHQSCDCI